MSGQGDHPCEHLLSHLLSYLLSFFSVVTETCNENVTVPNFDQPFWAFAADTSILSSNFWSGNCHDRDMTKF